MQIIIRNATPEQAQDAATAIGRECETKGLQILWQRKPGDWVQAQFDHWDGGWEPIKTQNISFGGEITGCPWCDAKVRTNLPENALECVNYPQDCHWHITAEAEALAKSLHGDHSDDGLALPTAEEMDGMAFAMLDSLEGMDLFQKLMDRMAHDMET